MNAKIFQKITLLLLGIMLLIGCGSASDAETGYAVAQEQSGSMDAAYDGDSADNMAAIPAPTLASQSGTNSSQRLIIKTGQMRLNVENTDLAVANAIDLIINAGGYIVNQNVYTLGDEYRAATLSLGIPVDRFESSIKVLRTYGEVESESANGQDVTEEYVDLNSQLENLQATQVRLREFLAAATNIKDTLAVDNELRQVEGEINIIQGRIKYLADRAAFSTIELEINPIIATVAPEPQSWQPATVAQHAVVTLQDGMQAFVDGAIYFIIAVLPWIIIWGVLGYIAYRIGSRLYARLRQPQHAQPVVVDSSGD